MTFNLAQNVAALQGVSILPRDFIEIRAKNRETGAYVFERIWSDIYPISAPVQSMETGLSTTLTFQAAAGLVSIGDVSQVADLSVSELEIQFASYGNEYERLVRAYDPTRARVTIWRGFLNPATREMVAMAEPIFFGEIDDIQEVDAADGQEASTSIVCVSSQELTRANHETRSDEMQRANRSPTDAFYRYSAVVGQWTLWWGQKKGDVAGDPAEARARRAGKAIRAVR